MTLDTSVLRTMVEWRRDIHAHPETAYTEFHTANLVARELAAMGLEVHRSLAKAGVAETLVNCDCPAIGLRADMDALFVAVQSKKPYASEQPGKMHACGHDGHTAMLLGAAKHLARYCQVNGETADAPGSNGKCQPVAGSEQLRQAGAARKKPGHSSSKWGLRESTFVNLTVPLAQFQRYRRPSRS